MPSASPPTPPQPPRPPSDQAGSNLPFSRDTLRRWINGSLLVVLLAGTAFAFWPFVAASRQMSGFCGGLKPGQPVAQVQQQASARGYALSVQADGQAVLDDVRSGGRRSCQLRFDAAGGLVTAAYSGQ